MSSRSRKIEERFHQEQVRLRKRFRAELRLKPASLGRRLTMSILARQQSARQRKIGDEGQTRAPAFVQNVTLRIPLQEAVLVLHADELCRARPRDFSRRAKLTCGKVGAADLPHLAGP